MAGELAEGDIVAGRYVVEGVIAEGGMGRVLAARHLELDVPIAIKLLKREDHDARDIQRFRREARAAAHLRGEHVVRVLDVGVLAGDRPFLVMERIDGVDLGTKLDAEGPLPAGVAVDLVLQACEGLAEAHRLGMVHRDLKPSNLLLTARPDGSALLKISDFGIAKWASGPATKLTTTADFLGSPKYMSPEQVREASDVDARADVWSLGVTLYQLVTARLPFEAYTTAGVLAAITAAGRSMFLTGVFLADSLPGSAPSSLSYGSNSAYQLSSYSPLLGQVFFIGDGLTGNGSGSAQKFYVPDGATRLYLGFVDGWGFSGTPGYYNDNSGSLTFSATLSGNTGGSVGETPEPATYALLGAGLIGFAIRRKTKKEA